MKFVFPDLPDGVPHKVTRVHDEFIVEPLDETVEAALEADREKSLRDVFATAALGALIAADKADRFLKQNAAREAYAYADAMLEVRKK